MELFVLKIYALKKFDLWLACILLCFKFFPTRYLSKIQSRAKCGPVKAYILETYSFRYLKKIMIDIGLKYILLCP